MVKFIGIELRPHLSMDRLSSIMEIFNTLPVIFEGVVYSKENRKFYQASDENPAYIGISECMETGRGIFVLDPEKESRLRWYFDSYLVNRKNFMAPSIISNPPLRKDPRSFSQIQTSLGNDNYMFNIYNCALDEIGL